MDYQRLVSYIYSYPEGVKADNVGFAKALVYQGQFKLNISLRGIKTENPEVFGVYIMVNDGGYRLIKLGEAYIKAGQMEYSGVYNPDNIEQSGYAFKDICGLAVAREDARYDCMLSMWKDEDVTPDMLVFAGMDSRKQIEAGIIIEEKMRQKEQQETGRIEADRQVVNTEQEQTAVQNDDTESCCDNDGETVEIVSQSSACNVQTQPDNIEKLFMRADYIDAFDDDYFYDCMEVSPERLKDLQLKEISVMDNSFLLHGYYNFRHILFGRVRDNLDNTRYFIGVPGMYCNRERYMASMFGFNNFKKSHRSDYANPYFGYWYQEI